MKIIDIGATRARADAATTECAEGSGAMVVLQRDVPDLCVALEHERRVSAAWRALAIARAEVAFSKAASRDGRTPSADAVRDAGAAREALVALGVDPEAP